MDIIYHSPEVEVVDRGKKLFGKLASLGLLFPPSISPPLTVLPLRGLWFNPDALNSLHLYIILSICPQTIMEIFAYTYLFS